MPSRRRSWGLGAARGARRRAGADRPLRHVGIGQHAAGRVGQQPQRDADGADGELVRQRRRRQRAAVQRRRLRLAPAGTGHRHRQQLHRGVHGDDADRAQPVRLGDRQRHRRVEHHAAGQPRLRQPALGRAPAAAGARGHPREGHRQRRDAPSGRRPAQPRSHDAHDGRQRQHADPLPRRHPDLDRDPHEADERDRARHRRARLPGPLPVHRRRAREGGCLGREVLGRRPHPAGGHREHADRRAEGRSDRRDHPSRHPVDRPRRQPVARQRDEEPRRSRHPPTESPSRGRAPTRPSSRTPASSRAAPSPPTRRSPSRRRRRSARRSRSTSS